MKKYFLLTYFLFALIMAGCTHHPKKILDITGERIAIDSTYDAYPDSLVSAIINKYKAELNERMSEVIGQSAQEMTARRPESLLSNFTADAMLEIAKESSKQQIDFSLMNFGGLRAAMPAGDITLMNLYTIYPFKNELVILSMDGKSLSELFTMFAAEKVEAMSNVVLSIKNKKTADIKINGKPFDENKTYTLVTLDFIAQGGDGMTMFSKAANYESTGLLLREAMVNYIKACTAKGKIIDSKLDGRVKVE